MTSDVIDTVTRLALSWCSPREEHDMTTTALSSFTSTEDRLRTVLRTDAVVTAAVGALALTGPTTWYGETPGWLVRTVGLVLLVTALEIGLLSRTTGRRLRLVGTVLAELAFLWVAGSVAVLALVDLEGTGQEVVALVAAATLGFGLAESALVRALPRADR